MFTVLHKSCFKAKHLALVLTLVLGAGNVVAASLVLPETVRVASGQTVNLNIGIDKGFTNEYSFQLLNAPVGASIELSANGAHLIWDTPLDLAAETVIIVKASHLNANPSENLSTRLSILRDDNAPASVNQASLAKQSNQAPIFPALPLQNLKVGEQYQLWMKASDPDATSVTIHAAGLPDGSSFETNANGGYTFRWTADATQAGSHHITFVAVDEADRQLQVERTLYFEVAGTELAQPAKVPAASILASLPGDNARSDQGVDMETLSTQIMGVGQLVKFPVIPIVAEGVEPVLQVDRLPKGASFDVNPLGVRVFHWQTSDADEGEHVFRISIFDKKNPASRAHQDVTVIIGDPTVKSSQPKALKGNVGLSIDAPELLSVKVGQSVRFRVNAADADGTRPVIKMSQSPVGAVLQQHPDGSKLFQWQPNPSQQGEHVISFVAQPNGSTAKKVHRDVLLKVGP